MSFPDLQDCPLKSFRPALHDSGNRKRGRTTPALPIRWLKNTILRATTTTTGGLNWNKNKRGNAKHVRYEKESNKTSFDQKPEERARKDESGARIDRRLLLAKRKGRKKVKGLRLYFTHAKGVSWPAGSRREANFFSRDFSLGFGQHYTALEQAVHRYFWCALHGGESLLF